MKVAKQKSEELARLAALVRQMKVGMLTTLEAADHQVNLSYADPRDEDFASISGTARVVRDPERMRALWTPELGRWFPRGLDEPDLALLEVRIDKAEYWDEPRNENVKIGTLAPQPQA